ncbi:MAG: aminodeoxychorismate lyase [Gammaproteobacteria bacterium]|nr:aminodeoxychorismate lyase [Gammaproteobacteria bacterium]|tara:strand:- start:882 stop:1760 length:879 start_codon:yes stop_codon:yes gene_type:complete
MVALTLVDGERADTVPVTDRGLLYGDGVFETLAYRQQQILQLTAHLQRLQVSCERLGIPIDRRDIERQIARLLSCLPSGADAPTEGVIKIIVTRGDGGRGYAPLASPDARCLIQFHPMPADYAGFSQRGISCMLCRHPVSANPALAGLKHLNRLDQVMASRELVAAQNGAGHDDAWLQEGLMFDVQGNLVEGTRSNVFAVISGQLCTPDLSEAGVSGIMRAALLDWFAGQGVTVIVRRIAGAELALASEIFICNSVMGIWPVNRVHDFSTETCLTLPDQALARRAQRGLLSD